MEHKGFVLWFTGLPCSGKTTVADVVAEKLKAHGMKIERLDGDIVRKSLTRDLGFSKEDRDKNIERVTFVAMILSRNGVGVLPAFVSPYIGARQRAREETTNFIEVFVKARILPAIFPYIHTESMLERRFPGHCAVQKVVPRPAVNLTV